MYLPRMAIHTATGEASRVYSISLKFRVRLRVSVRVRIRVTDRINICILHVQHPHTLQYYILYGPAHVQHQRCNRIVTASRRAVNDDAA